MDKFKTTYMVSEDLLRLVEKLSSTEAEISKKIVYL